MPDAFEVQAAELIDMVLHKPDASAHRLIAHYLRGAYQRGVVEGVDRAQRAVDEAFGGTKAGNG